MIAYNYLCNELNWAVSFNSVLILFDQSTLALIDLIRDPDVASWSANVEPGVQGAHKATPSPMSAAATLTSAQLQ